MEITQIIYAALSISALGLIFGIGLGFAAKKFEVKQDPLIPTVQDLLPGVNCGGCGFAGCAALAKAIVTEGVSPLKCPVASNNDQKALAQLLGLEVVIQEKRIAFVKCKGKVGKTRWAYQYDGIDDCSYAHGMQNQGPKMCAFGCLGMGSCVKACLFDAIHIVDGIALVDEEKCTHCGQCIATCPKDIIESIPYKETHTRVTCHSNNKGKLQKDSCDVGCIGCKLCEKACEYDAIHVDNFLAKVDYSKCVNCFACVGKCPTKVIDQFRLNV